jgi:hypothetical protein
MRAVRSFYSLAGLKPKPVIIRGDKMNRARNITLIPTIIATIIMMLTVAGVARDNNNNSSPAAVLVEEYGFRVQLPNEAWSFQQSAAHDVKAQLQHSQDPAQIRLQAAENLKGRSDRKLMEEYQKHQKKFDRSILFDKNIPVSVIGAKNWYILSGKKSGATFSIHFNFEKENVFMVTYETPTTEMFEKHAVERDAFIKAIEFGAAPVKRFSDYNALEIEVVPVDKARLDLEDITKISGEIKDQLPASVFKEVRAGRTNTTEKTLLLTVEVKFFKRGSRAKRYIVGFGAGKSALDADLVFTDKETGKRIYTNQVSHETTGGFFGGASFEGVGDQVADIVKRKK